MIAPKLTRREENVLIAYDQKGARLIETLSEQSGESKSFVRKVIKKFKLENTG